MSKENIADFLAFASASSVVYGVAQVAPALAWVVGGLIGWGIAYLHAIADQPPRDQSGPTS